MKRWYRTGFSFCAIGLAILCLAAEPTTIPPDEENPNEVRPTGVPHRQHSQAKIAQTANSNRNANASAPPVARGTHRATTKPREQEDTIPTQTVPGSIPKIGASSVIVVDVHSGQVLYEKNPEQIRAPASTTKLLTGLIVAESGDLDRAVTVAQVDTFAEPVKLNIKPGEIYQRIDLLRALLVKSPNDVARCLARDNAGSIEAFAERMNRRAAAVGATHSHFVNPNGLPDARQYSTARDLSTIARVAYANSTIRSIVCLPQLVFRFANGRTRELENTNKLLKRLPYCNGMKTGYTEAAGKCLIASGSRPGKDVIVVLLCGTHSSDVRLEAALAKWKGTEAALSFGSGYAAAVGAIPALVGKNDITLLDKLCHASLIDGAKLSAATLRIFPHNHLGKLKSLLGWGCRKNPTARILIITESVFSMDGDRAPLREIVELKKNFRAQLLLDEAHAICL